MPDTARPGAEQWVPDVGGLPALREAAEDCRGCELWEDATQVVVSAGRAGAAVMLVGEQPGDQEDRAGHPFVGPAGRVLADATRAAGLGVHDLYVTNAVKHFRFERQGTRRIHQKPGVGHITACHPWLRSEIDIVRPRVIVCLGATAARAVLGRPVAIGTTRGRLLDERVGGAAVLVTAHPSSVLRAPDPAGRAQALAAVVADLRVVSEALGGARADDAKDANDAEDIDDRIDEEEGNPT